MPDPVETVKEVAEAVSHPIEKAKRLEKEAERGRSARTPIIAITGVTIVVGVILAVMLVVLFLVYYLA